MIDTLPLGEIGGQHAPLDPPFGHIKDGIEYGPHTQGARSSTAFGGGDHIFDPLPFLVGQVAWIYFFVHLPILHNPRRLFRQALKGAGILPTSASASSALMPTLRTSRSGWRRAASPSPPRRISHSSIPLFQA